MTARQSRFAMYGTVESQSDVGLTTAEGISFGATCSICESQLTTAYYRVNGHEICRECRGPVMSQLVRQHGSVVGAFLRGWLFGALSGASGYVVYMAAMTLLHGYGGLVTLIVGPVVWEV